MDVSRPTKSLKKLTNLPNTNVEDRDEMPSWVPRWMPRLERNCNDTEPDQNTTLSASATVFEIYKRTLHMWEEALIIVRKDEKEQSAHLGESLSRLLLWDEFFPANVVQSLPQGHGQLEATLLKMLFRVSRCFIDFLLNLEPGCAGNEIFDRARELDTLLHRVEYLVEDNIEDQLSDSEELELKTVRPELNTDLTRAIDIYSRSVIELGPAIKKAFANCADESEGLENQSMSASYEEQTSSQGSESNLREEYLSFRTPSESDHSSNTRFHVVTGDSRSDSISHQLRTNSKKRDALVSPKVTIGVEKEDSSSLISHRSLSSRCMGPIDYAALVDNYARHSVGKSIFSGDLFEGLALFLNRLTDKPNLQESHVAGPSAMTWLDVVVYDLTASEKPIPRLLSKFSELRKLQETFCSRSDGESNVKSALIILRGHQTPECLNWIGAMCNINPLFFQQHLRYRWAGRHRKLFGSHILPSTSQNIVRLKIVTLGERMHEKHLGSRLDIHALRAQAKAAMADYSHNIVREYGLQAGDSVVRNFNLHSLRYFSIEQELTITVQLIEDRWIVLVWTDAANDLGKGPTGPWRSKLYQDDTEKSSILPTVHHFPLDATLSWLNLPTPVYSKKAPYSQSASLLAQAYGQTLDPNLMRMDSFYCITELFQFSASSICQQLNLVEGIIDENTGYNLLEDEQYSLASLLYHEDILERIASRLRENILDLRECRSAPWPRSYWGQSQEAKAAAAACLVLQDFEQLLSRAENLTARCRGGMAVYTNSAVIAESRIAMAQAREVERLTRLAFFFIPLTFTASFFGMNLVPIGSGSWKLWLWVVMSFSLVVLSHAAFWPIRIQRWFALLQQVFKRA